MKSSPMAWAIRKELERLLALVSTGTYRKAAEGMTLEESVRWWRAAAKDVGAYGDCRDLFGALEECLQSETVDLRPPARKSWRNLWGALT